LLRGEKLQRLQREEAEVVKMCKSMEITAIRMITHWRPLHADLVKKTRLVKFRLQSLVEICRYVLK